jgi:glutamine synthetase
MLFLQLLSNNIDDDDYNIKNLLSTMEEESVNFVIFLYLDINCDLKEVLIPFSNALKSLKNGIKYSNGKLIADLDSFKIIPWMNDDRQKTALFMSYFYSDNYKDPRLILKEQIKNLLDLHSIRFISKCSLEFSFFNDNNEAIDSIGDNDVEYNYIREQEKKIIIQSLEQLNINIENIVHGKSNGQLKILLKDSDPLDMADSIILTKYILKTIAEQLNFKITFMPKPLINYYGNNLTIDFKLIDVNNERNIIKSSNVNISKKFYNFISGNIRYVNDLFILYLSSINSYKRLNLDLLNKNLICAKDDRVKFKIADCQSNPYIVFSSLIFTGLKGIDENLNLDNTCYKLNNVISYSNFRYYFDFMKKSNLAKDLLGNNLHNIICKNFVKLINDFENIITNWEFNRYFNKF